MSSLPSVYARQSGIQDNPVSFWPDDIDVLLTSFWGWSPETWGAVGFTSEGRRRNLLNTLSNPFITVCYVTSNKNFIDSDIKGKIAGFYLVSHETGDRDAFSHPNHHSDQPDKWRFSLRAIRAFTYLPEYRIGIKDFDSSLIDGGKARSIASSGKLVADREQIDRLRNIPFEEVAIYTPLSENFQATQSVSGSLGLVQAGPANREGYFVAGGKDVLPRELYILRLHGNTSAYLGYPSDNATIFKVGLSVSPDMRRQKLQKSMPEGAYKWAIERSTRLDGAVPYSTYAIAEKGELAMKCYLAEHAKWLGGEFYLATEKVIKEAWREGQRASSEFTGKVSE